MDVSVWVCALLTLSLMSCSTCASASPTRVVSVAISSSYLPPHNPQPGQARQPNVHPPLESRSPRTLHFFIGAEKYPLLALL